MSNFSFLFRQLKENIIYQLDYFFDLIFKNKKKINDFLEQSDTFLDVREIHTPKFTVHNNKWGEYKITQNNREDYQQMIDSDAWIFQTPVKNYGVIGYPSIVFYTDDQKVSDISSYTFNYNFKLSMEKNRKYNLAFDFWISPNETFSFQTVTHEIMIWEDYFVSSPFGKHIGNVTISGDEYRVYSGFVDKSDTNIGADGWNIISFLKVNRVTSNTINFREVLDYLLDKGFIDNDYYLHRSELGTEVFNCSGRVDINNFTYSIQL